MISARASASKGGISVELFIAFLFGVIVGLVGLSVFALLWIERKDDGK